jgi:hypothetical protein
VEHKVENLIAQNTGHHTPHINKKSEKIVKKKGSFLERLAEDARAKEYKVKVFEFPVDNKSRYYYRMSNKRC